MADELPSDFLDDDESDAFAAEWEAVDAQAALILAESWPDTLSDREPPASIEGVADRIRSGVGAGTWPYDYFAPDFAAGLPEHLDPSEVWLDCAASTISPVDDPTVGRGLGVDESALLGSAVHADWLALVLGVVRRGVGAELTGEHVLADLQGMDELEGEVEDLDELRTHFETLVALLAPRWQALRALDDRGRLTELGLWGLPRALHLVWDQSDDPRGDGGRL